MTTKLAAFAALAAIILTAGTAHAYDFWGIRMGTASYDGSSQLTFEGVGSSSARYSVGGYKYTRVDGTWYGAFDAAAPGEGFLAGRKSDAQGIFFKADVDAARFTIITGSSQSGATAPECGTGTRQFGPGDLKLDFNGQTLGVGMRTGNLLWAVDPYTANPELRIHSAGGGYEDIYARDAATVGRIELDPRWARVGHSTLGPNSDPASAFFLSGSGTLIGSAAVSFQDTGISMCGARVYAYEVAVPWAALGMGPNAYAFSASWRPDCGNDIISLDAALIGAVPEPGSIVALLTGIAGLAVLRRR